MEDKFKVVPDENVTNKASTEDLLSWLNEEFGADAEGSAPKDPEVGVPAAPEGEDVTPPTQKAEPKTAPKVDTPPDAPIAV